MRPLLSNRTIGLIALALSLIAAPALSAESLTIFAAASLKNALDDVNAVCAPAAGGRAAISYAGSSALARQIEAGAPADIFISADLDWMDYLAGKQMVLGKTRTNLLGNALVLIAPGDTKLHDVAPAAGLDLAAMLGTGRLAMADVKAVPAGRYGKAALESLGAWSAVEGRLAQTENVRAALKLVATGEAALGIVYRTDAQAEPGVKTLGRFPEGAHPPIIYPAAQIAGSMNENAMAFMECMRSDQAKVLFEAQGFSVLAPIFAQ
ncbi:molybdate ABC transporter substrate-binding protein [Mesorhizobium sp. NBSH29]|uniref:molybdate ABC transporter substrate-binding protein n=1 Tax=Mesorhizobium sp. NBSH29 TaxID=2654249 RepID=UPI0018965695|nr:molybdate ABC transporter substrate-binding protein [Mesorhizobium sp. NBSH29]QPC86684.1 molybdate ABC transporter substrate-binding protein [Mesorhizobium sp. NBSH29]